MPRLSSSTARRPSLAARFFDPQRTFGWSLPHPVFATISDVVWVEVLCRVVDAGVSKIERDAILFIEQHGPTFLASSRHWLMASFEADSREGSQKLTSEPEKAFVLAHLWADRRYAAMLGLGFSSGIPFLLVYVTQSAWLSEAKVPIETIGLMSEADHRL